MAIEATPVVIVLTAAGLDLAERIVAELPGAEIHGLVRRVPGAPIRFDRTPD